jgi:hypothetical protein
LTTNAAQEIVEYGCHNNGAMLQAPGHDRTQALYEFAINRNVAGKLPFGKVWQTAVAVFIGCGPRLPQAGE